jgi:hypothetical protein
MTIDPPGLIGAVVILAGFAGLFIVLRLPDHARRALTLTGTALSVLGNPTLDDDAKEEALQQTAKRLFVVFFTIVLAGSAALLVPAGVVWLADRAGLLSFETVMRIALSWPFLIGSTMVMTLAAIWMVRAQAGSQGSLPANSYSPTEQVIHQVAFATRPLQAGLARLEDLLADGRIARTRSPVFVTALPRAGTTLLLELLRGTGEFATHTYRSMPFVLMPLTWAGYMRRFGRADVARERAHGDGMLVSVDSPEAFEEMLWLTYYPERYTRPTIATWKPTPHEKFETFFARHRDKVVHLAQLAGEPRASRYLSKNNLNIARIDWLLGRIEDMRAVIPFREPYQHAASLLRQHRNFTRMHGEDPFACEYMAGIGHFDFGANLKPVDFQRWRTTNPELDPNTLSFWLTYWCAAYEDLLSRKGSRVALLDFDALCGDPEPVLTRLAAFVGLADHRGLTLQHTRLEPLPPHLVDSESIPDSLAYRARDIASTLRNSRL